MTPDLQEEITSLRDRAMALLRDVPESGSYRRVYSLWTLPSFTPPHRCVIYAPLPHAKDKKPFASFLTWRSDLDLEKYRTPVERIKYPRVLSPTMEESVVWLPEELILRIQTSLQGIQIAVVLGRPNAMGCDGTSFIFEDRRPFSSVSLEWWEQHPQEWKPFTDVVRGIAAEIDAERFRQSETKRSHAI